MENKKLRVLFVPILIGGHVYSSISIAETLIASGHDVWFTVNGFWSGKLVKHGIKEEYIATDDSVGDTTADVIKLMVTSGALTDASPLRKANDQKIRSEFWINNLKLLDRELERLLPAIRPDVIFVDQVTKLPAVELSGIPCVWVYSCGPLEMIDDERTPPGESGLSVTGDKRLWQNFRHTIQNSGEYMWREINDLVVGRGCRPLPKYSYRDHSHYLNIYSCPAELDYQDVRPLGTNFVQFDNFKRQTEPNLTFVVPPELAAKPGALVYFSLGSMGAADVANMRRLVTILAKSPHRFIVSMGPLHKKYTLADNMWGQEWVPQLRVLPLVDLVLTHGGNNTVTETMFFGKPMIVMPLFGDQYDSAQQLHDKGFGLRLDAYKCSEEELLAAIETLLNDSAMAERLAEVSRRIQADNSLAKLPKLIDDFVKNPQKYLTN